MARHISQTCPDKKQIGQNIPNGGHNVVEDFLGNQIFANHRNVDPTADLWQLEIRCPGLRRLD